MLVGLVEVDALLLAELVDRHPDPGGDETTGDRQIEPPDERPAGEEPIKTDSEPRRCQTQKQQSQRKSLKVHNHYTIKPVSCPART